MEDTYFPSPLVEVDIGDRNRIAFYVASTERQESSQASFLAHYEGHKNLTVVATSSMLLSLSLTVTFIS